MRETPKRVIGVILALALIVIFVIGAVELATNQDTDKAAKQTDSTSQVSQTSESTAQSTTVGNDSEGSTGSSNQSNSNSSVESVGQSSHLPSTGPSDVILVCLSISVLAFLSRAYWQSRQELRHWQLNRS